MMKRKVALLLAMLLAACMCTGVLAETTQDGESVENVQLIDVPNTPTTDAVLSLDAVAQDGQGTAHEMKQVAPDQLTVNTLLDIFGFVVDEEQRPARYFPEETQKQIAEAMGGGDIDILNMTEFLRLEVAPGDVNADVQTVMVLDVDYQPGQLVVAVLADTTDPTNLVWTALKAVVTADGTVEVVIPQELMEAYLGENILYSVLTPRRGMRRYYLEKEEVKETVVIPSVSASETSYVKYIVKEDGEPVEAEFELLIVDETEEQIAELRLLRDYVRNQKQALITWFPEEDRNEIKLLLGKEMDLNDLVVYDFLALQSSGYQDTYGDVMAEFSFMTPYKEGQAMVAMLGIPKEDPISHVSQMDWAVQLVRVHEDGSVQVAFDQLMMIEMGEETGLLLLLAERLEQ